MTGLLDALDELTASLGHLAAHPGVDVTQELLNVGALQERVQVRQAFAPATLVIGIAGTTGAGKSSLFNYLTGSAAAQVGVKRPTTMEPMAAIYGTPEAGTWPLLDWLQVPHRYSVSESAPDLGSTILIDLPDIDSISTKNREVAERFIESVDVLLWVVDPEKYADARIHEAYLNPLAEHAAVMEILLNQVDRLTPGEAEDAQADLQERLESAGVRAPVFGISVRQGRGLEELTRRLSSRSLAKRDQQLRAQASALTLATDLAESHPFTLSPAQVKQIQREFNANVLGAVDLDSYVAADIARYRHTLKAASGWPPLRVLRKSTSVPAMPRLRSSFLGEPIGRLRSAFAGPGTWNQALRATVDSASEELLDRVNSFQPNESATNIPKGIKFVGMLHWLGLAILAVAGVAFGLEIVVRYFGITLPPALSGVDASPGYPELPDLRWSYFLAIIGIIVTGLVMLISTISVRAVLFSRRRRTLRLISAEIAAITDLTVGSSLRETINAGLAYAAALTKITSRK